MTNRPMHEVKTLYEKIWRRVSDSTLAQNAAWMFLGQGTSFVVQAGYFVVLARLLGSYQFGIYAAAVALVSMVSQYSTLGSGLMFLQHVSPDHNKFNVYWGNILMATIGIGTAMTVAIHLFGSHLIGRTSAPLLILVGLGDCVFQQLTTCSSQVFQTFERMRITAILNAVVNIFRLIIAMAMLGILHGATAKEWAWAALLVSAAATVAAVIIVSMNFGKPSFSLRSFIKSAGDGFVYAVSGSTTTVYNDIDKVLMGRFGMIAANGVYSMAYRVVNIGTMPMISIYSAAFPKFFRLGTEGMSSTVPFARKLLKKTTVLGCISAAGMFLCAPAIPYIVGKSFAQSVPALRWLCLIPLFRSFHLSAGDAIAGAGHQKFRLLGQFIAAGMNLGLNLYLIPKYSWWGAAWASLATDGALGVISWSVALFLLRRESSARLQMSAIL